MAGSSMEAEEKKHSPSEMDPKLQKLLSLLTMELDATPEVEMPSSEEQLFLTMPSSLIDSVMSYLGAEIKVLFNTCRQLRSHLQSSRFWADFKVRIVMDRDDSKKGKMYFICFVRKYIEIYEARIIGERIWSELAQYFGIWEIDCNLNWSTVVRSEALGAQRSRFLDLAEHISQVGDSELANQVTVKLEQTKTEQPVVDAATGSATFADLVNFARGNILCMRLNGEIRANDKHLAGDKSLTFPRCVCIDASQRCPQLDLFEREKSELVDAADSTEDNMDSREEVCIGEIYPKLKILSLGSIHRLWRTHALQKFACDPFVRKNLVVLRLFDVTWRSELPLVLPDNLELFRFTGRDSEHMANPSAGGGSAVSQSGKFTDDSKGLSSMQKIEYNRKTKMHVKAIDFSRCNKLTEIICDMNTIEMMFPLFDGTGTGQGYGSVMGRLSASGRDSSLVEQLEEIKLNESDGFMSVASDGSHVFIERTRKTQAELLEVLPSLQRIVFVDYVVEQTRLRNFLVLAEPWLRLRGVELVFPKVDAKALKALALDGQVEDSDRGGDVDLLSDDDDDDDSDIELILAGETADIDERRLETRRVRKSKKSKKRVYGFAWSTWQNDMKAKRLSVKRWRGSPDYSLYAKVTAWKLWWLRDVQKRHEVYNNLIF